MTQKHRTRSLVATAAAATLALTACGGGDDSAGETSSPGGGGKESSASADAGESVTASKSRVSFTVPTGWEPVDVTDKKASENPPTWLKDAAKEQKVTPAKVLQAWSQSGMEVVVAGDATLEKSISVANLPTMPTESQLKSQLKEAGSEVSSPKNITTGAGQGFSVSSGDQKTSQQLLIVPAEKGAAVIQVVAPDAGTAKDVSTTITESIEKA